MKKITVIISIFVVLIHLQGCSRGKEAVMGVALKTEVVNPVVSSGDAINVRLSLTNMGNQALELPSLDENNDITNYILEDEGGKKIGTYNHISRQVLLEFQRVTYGEQIMKTLAPGETEARDYNLLLLHWLDAPGKYRIRGFYKWKQYEVLSEPVSFEIVPAAVRAYNQQWSYNYGGKFYLHSAMVVESQNQYHLILKQAQRFSPRVVDFNHAIYKQHDVFYPHVSFNRTLLADSIVWLAWLSGSTLKCLQTDYGQVSKGPVSIDTGLSDARLIDPLFLNGDNSATVMVTGKTEKGENGVMIIKIDDSGKEATRHFVGFDEGTGYMMKCLPDEDGNTFLVWVEKKDGICFLKCLPLNADEAKPAGKMYTLLQTNEKVLAVVARSLIRMDDGSLFCVTMDEKNKTQVMLTRVPLDGQEQASRIKKVKFESKSDVTSVFGDVDEQEGIHCVFATESGQVLYLDFMEEKLMDVTDNIKEKTPSLLHFFINDRNDIYIGYHSVSKGLDWHMIRAGLEEQLEPAEEDDLLQEEEIREDDQK